MNALDSQLLSMVSGGSTPTGIAPPAPRVAPSPIAVDPVFREPNSRKRIGDGFVPTESCPVAEIQ